MHKRLNPNFLAARPVDYPALMRLVDQGYVMMGWADPFFPDPCLPAYVTDAAKRSLDGAGSHYSVPIGAKDLRIEIAKKLERFNGLHVDPDSEIVVTPGSDTGLWQAMQVVIAPGDEVINFEPSYPSNARNTMLMGATNVSISLDPVRGFEIDPVAVERAISERTKAIVLTQPNNPTTTVQPRGVMQALSELAIAHDLFVIVDQAFEETVETGRELVTMATLPGMRERTISVFSTSKGLGMSGFRVGYNVASPEIMQVMHNTAVSILGATNTSAQEAALAAMRDDSYVADFRRIYSMRRRLAVETLNRVPGVRCGMPQSGFMVWPDVSALGTSTQVFEHLRDDAGIIVAGGANFGPSGEGHIRIMLSALRDDDAFVSAFGRLVTSLGKLAASA